MAETKTRSQSIQAQIDRLMEQAPKPYTAEEIKQIEKGRKGQKDIDEGRALVSRRNDEVKAFNEQIERLNEQLGKAAESEAKLGTQAADRAKQEAREAEKRSPFGVAVQVGSGLPAGAAGYMLGRKIGGGINREADVSQASKNATLSQAAQDRVAGLTTREGARTGIERAGAMPSRSSVGRFIGRAGPQAAIGGLMAGKGALLASTVSEDDPLLNQGINQGFAAGLIGAGVGLGEKGLQYGFNPGVAPDARSIAIMESNQLRRNPQGLSAVDKGALEALPDEAKALPAPTGPKPGTRDYLAEQAKGPPYNLKVTTRMGKKEIADAMAVKLQEIGTKRTRAPRLPKGTGAAGIAGGLAYAMTPDGAQAADGSGPSSNTGQGLINAGVAGGAAYGASRAMDKIGPVARTVMSGAGEAMAPLAIDSMTDYSPTEQLQGRVMLGEHLPEWAQSAPIQQAHQMAQVPSRNPIRPQAGMFEGQSDAELHALLSAFLQEAEGFNAEAY